MSLWRCQIKLTTNIKEEKELPPDTIILGSPGSGKVRFFVKPIPSGTGMTRAIINPILQQEVIDATCEKMEEELSETIDTK